VGKSRRPRPTMWRSATTFATSLSRQARRRWRSRCSQWPYHWQEGLVGPIANANSGDARYRLFAGLRVEDLHRHRVMELATEHVIDVD